MNNRSTLQLKDCLLQACLIEVLSEKPGNVSPTQSFADSAATDFVRSAQVTAPLLAESADLGVGQAVHAAAHATRDAVGHNTNLGILLLLSPLAAVPRETRLIDGISAVLSRLTVTDADWAYRAIRVAEPGGLGSADSQDVHSAPTETLLECMQRAASRDLIAQQYSTDFTDVLGDGLDWLAESEAAAPPSQRIGWLALKLLARHGDSLIERKCGEEASLAAQSHAAAVLAAGWPRTTRSADLWQRFDEWLRSDGNRLNPGTTADMIAAILFAGLRTGQYVPDETLHSQIADWTTA